MDDGSWELCYRISVDCDLNSLTGLAEARTLREFLEFISNYRPRKARRNVCRKHQPPHACFSGNPTEVMRQLHYKSTRIRNDRVGWGRRQAKPSGDKLDKKRGNGSGRARNINRRQIGINRSTHNFGGHLLHDDVSKQTPNISTTDTKVTYGGWG